MNIIKDEKKIKRNNKIGSVISTIGLIAIGISLYVTFPYLQASERMSFKDGIIMSASLLIGLIFTQIGIYYSNRWGRSPRPDEKLDTGLKGLPKDYNMYHWTTPVSHLLVGPAGIWVLLPYHQKGKVTYQKNRWKLRSGGFVQGYLRVFGQEGIGRPDLVANAEINLIHKALAKKMEEDEIPEIKAALVFTADEVDIDAEDAPTPTLEIKKLKSFIRQLAREKPISMKDIEKVKAIFSE